MGNRAVRAGDTIRLRILVKDDLGDDIQASGVFVSIFDPLADFADISTAFTVSGTPTYLGEGIFEYEFMTPLCGPDGTWIDSWVAQTSCQDITGVHSFDVTTSGLTQAIDCQLFCNDIVQVTIASGLMASDGSFLDDAFDAEFLTTTSPTYTNVRKVRLEVGSFVSSIPDDILQMAILEASLEADVLTFAPVLTNNALYQHARREYATCVASQLLLTNVGNLLLRTKTLADLHVEYDTNGVRDAMGRLQDCMEQWTPQLMAGGGARAVTQPRMVIKGELDPDRPVMSRMWSANSDGVLDNRVPAANTRIRQQGKRRAERTYHRTPNGPIKGKKWW